MYQKPCTFSHSASSTSKTLFGRTNLISAYMYMDVHFSIFFYESKRLKEMHP